MIITAGRWEGNSPGQRRGQGCRQAQAEISSPDYPGERLIACHNPFLAQERAAHRQRLLAATEAELAKITAMVEAGRLADPAKIGVRAGKVINKRKVGKHFLLDIGEAYFAWRRDQDNIDAEAAFDGIYIIRTPLPAQALDAPAAVACTVWGVRSRLGL